MNSLLEDLKKWTYNHPDEIVMERLVDKAIAQEARMALMESIIKADGIQHTDAFCYCIDCVQTGPLPEHIQHDPACNVAKIIGDVDG
jgi:hypothetical protein